MRSRGREHGFTLLEVLIVAMVAATLLATALMVLPGVVEAARSDSGSSQLGAVLRQAREQSISERRNIEIRFIGPNRVEAWRDDIDANGVVDGQTLVQEAVLEQGVVYGRFDGMPDTPDGFADVGAFTAAGGAAVFTGVGPWRFTTEGQLVDANGDVVNGTVFLGQQFRPDTARAVSLFGPTALIRDWRWNGAGWIE
jgi:prepilin-type N-terminal cleavage/methylation domain-containing protein